MRPLIGIPTRTYIDDTIVRFAVGSAYTRALELAGAAPIAIPLQLGEDTLSDIFARLDGLLIAGGVDVHPSEFGEEVEPFCGEIDRERDVVELQLLRWAIQQERPVFGICRGIQMLNVAAGGTLYQDIDAQVEHALHDVNSLHHQSVKQVAPDFRIVARAPDGIVEGIEHLNGSFAVGVQFHPEWLIDDDARMVQMFKHFVDAANHHERTSA